MICITQDAGLFVINATQMVESMTPSSTKKDALIWKIIGYVISILAAVLDAFCLKMRGFPMRTGALFLIHVDLFGKIGKLNKTWLRDTFKSILG